MRILIGGIAYNETGIAKLDAGSVRYKGTTADPVPTCNVSLVDNNSSITIAPLAELIILDEKVLPNPTQNFLQNPSLLSAQSARYTQVTSGGFTGSLTFAGGGGLTATITGGGGSAFGEETQTTQAGLIVPGQTYMLSGYLNIATPMTNSNAYLSFQFLDAAGNSLGSISAGTFTTTAGTIRINTAANLGIAPAGAVYIKIHFGVQQTGVTPSGTAVFSTLQLEPMWFPSIVSYPSPDCNPAQSNCVLLPNNTTVRQYRKFGGLVVDAIAGDYKGNVRTIQITANGYAWIFSLIYDASNFVNTTDANIIGTYIAGYFPASAAGLHLFTTTGVITGNTIDNLQANWDDLRSIFNGFAANAGYYWTADAYWNFLFQPPGYTQMPISLIADNSGNPDGVTTFPIYNFKAETDVTQIGASVLVLGGTASTSLLTALTNGVGVTSLDVAPLPVPVLSGTAMYISGNQGVTLSANAAAGATTLSINLFTPLKNYGVGSSISTNPYVALAIDPANTSIYNQALYGFGIPGQIFMRKVNDGSLQSVADVTNRGIAELIQYSPPRKLYHGMTNVEPLVGQGIQITSNTDGLNATTLLIQQATAQWLGVNEFLQDLWEYQVDFGAVNRTATSILSSIFRQTTKNNSAPTITNTALAAFERFGFVDTPQYPYPLTVLSDVPVAYYRLGEAASGNVYDSSGNNYIGNYNGSGVTYGVAGAILNDPNTAVTFDGAAGFATTPTAASVGAFAALTLEAWVKLSNISFSGFPRILSDDFTQGDNNGVEFLFSPFGAGLIFNIGNGTTFTSLVANYQFQAGVYYHVVANWGAGGASRIFVNGVQIASAAGVGGTIGGPSNNMAIGYNPFHAGDFLAATVDEVAWYQVQLSGTRILKHYTVGVTGKA